MVPPLHRNSGVAENRKWPCLDHLIRWTPSIRRIIINIFYQSMFFLEIRYIYIFIVVRLVSFVGLFVSYLFFSCLLLLSRSTLFPNRACLVSASLFLFLHFPIFFSLVSLGVLLTSGLGYCDLGKRNIYISSRKSSVRNLDILDGYHEKKARLKKTMHTLRRRERAYDRKIVLLTLIPQKTMTRLDAQEKAATAMAAAV